MAKKTLNGSTNTCLCAPEPAKPASRSRPAEGDDGGAHPVHVERVPRAVAAEEEVRVAHPEPPAQRRVGGVDPPRPAKGVGPQGGPRRGVVGGGGQTTI